MTKLGRRAIYGDTCAADGCTAPRAVLSVRKGTPSRSRFCRSHYNSDVLARHNAKHPPEPEPAGCTVAEAYQQWAQGGMPPTFHYDGKRVYVISAFVKWNGVTGYELVLAGDDEPLWVAETTRLEVAT